MKKLFIVIFCLWFTVLNVQCAYAQATVPPVANSFSGVLTGNMLGRGFSLADPRVAATLRAVGATMARWAAAAGVAAFAGTGVGAALVGAAYLCSEYCSSLAKWKWNKDTPGKVIVGEPPKVAETPPMVKGGKVTSVSQRGTTYVRGTDVLATANQFASMMGTNYRLGNCSEQSSSQWWCSLWEYDPSRDRWNYNAGSFNVSVYDEGAPADCGGGSYIDQYDKCVALTPVYQGTSGTPVSLQTAINNIPGLDGTKPLNPEIVASIANSAWIEAASIPGYDGIPYDYTKPITTAAAQDWAIKHVDYWPKVNDFTKPLDPATNPFTLPLTNVPTSVQAPATGNTGTNSAASNPAANLGSDPGIGAPMLEDIPTAEAIMRPILNMLPDLKNFQAPASGAQCPKPTFQAFEQTFTMDKHCDLAEQNRAAIKAGMMVVFSLAALLIVLRA